MIIYASPRNCVNYVRTIFRHVGISKSNPFRPKSISQRHSWYSARNYSSDVDPRTEPELLSDCEKLVPNFSFKKLLYQDGDVLLNAMNASTSATDLLDLLIKSKQNFTKQHLVQTVVLLSEFCRMSGTERLPLLKTIQGHSAFQLLIDELLKLVTELDPSESTCCFLYLHRVGLDSSHLLLHNLLEHNLRRINLDESIPLPALSRFSVAVSCRKDLNSIQTCHNMMPHLVKFLKICSSDEDIRLITICLYNLRHLVSTGVLESYKSKVRELINRKVINTESTKSILKIIHFLNQHTWSNNNSAELRQLMLLLLPTIEHFGHNEIKTVFGIFQSQLEPAALLPKLIKANEKLLEQKPMPDILSSAVQYSDPKKRGHYIELFETMLKDDKMWQHTNASLYFFRVLRALKIADIELCDYYWNTVLEKMKSSNEEQDLRVLVKHCHRYMYFNNNLGGTYRHKPFEKFVSHLCMNDLTSGLSGMIPSKFAETASFIIAYGHSYKGSTRFPNFIISKIESMSKQFNPISCLQLSRGIQIALEMRFRNFIPPTLTPQLVLLEKFLDECAERHLNSMEEMSANDLNLIVRALNNRKASRKSRIYQRAMNKYNEVQFKTLNSRVLRNMSFDLSYSRFVAPQILEKMFKYVVKYERFVTGSTAEKILSCSYDLGYSPQLQDGVHSSANIIMRDFDYMPGLSIIQACLALCFYKAVSEKLINRVFSTDFIKRIEDEIQICYSKTTYPERVMNQVMQLNRSVCLDFPEGNIPWFQQSYLEAQLRKFPNKQSAFSDDVKQGLLSVLKDESLFRCNHVTPYGYTIDFVIHFDDKNQPMSAPVETTVLDKITKVAILLLKVDSICENDFSTLRGKEALKVRHLEMLGYKVVHVNEADWKQMKLADNKRQHLKCLLQISR